MTTPNVEELITYLRSFFINENVSAIKANWIANAMQSQAERIAELEANLRVAQMSTVDKCAEIYTLRAQLAESADLLQSQAERIAELEDRITELTSEEHSIPELRQMLDDSYAEKQKCYFALSQHQLAHTNLLTERDTLRAQLADAELHTKQVERGLDKATAQLAEIEKTEPVFYEFQWTNPGNQLHQPESRFVWARVEPAWNGTVQQKVDELLAYRYNDKPIYRVRALFTRPMPAQDVKDAERYRWLREQHWSTDTIAVVLNPKQAVKLGYVCPSDSLLDETIDAAITKGAKW